MSPPPRAPSASFSPPPHAVSNGAVAAAGYERVPPVNSAPPASTLVIQEPPAPSTPSPAPAAASGAPRKGTAGEARSAKHSNNRDGAASISKSNRSSGGTSWLYGDSDSFIRVPSRNAFLYLVVTAIEAAIVITLVTFIFVRIVTQVDNLSQNLKTVSVYLAVFVFGCVFQVLISWDAVRLKNTMQLIGVLIFNLALTATAAIEIRQVRDALNAQDRVAGGFPCPDDPSRLCRANSLFPSVERYLIAVTGVCFVIEFFLIYLTFKLWKEFGWVIYQKIGADLRVRRMFFWYQLFIVFLKFAFFFGVGFTVIYLILVAQTTDWEYGVTIAAVPIAMVALFAAGFAVRREWTSLMVLSLLLMMAGMAYFVFKLTQVWLPGTRDEYTYVHTTITFISGFACASLGLTLLNGLICLFNFHKGLKPAHDAIGRFGGVHRQRKSRSGPGVGAGNGDTEAAVLDLEDEENDREGEKGQNGMTNGGPDPRMGGGAMQSPMCASPSGEMTFADRRASAVAQSYAMHSPTPASPGNGPLYAPQSPHATPHIPASLQPASPMHSPRPTSQHFYPQQQQLPNPYTTLADSHPAKPTASRVSLD
ncbi:hypothetical protein PHBOTO_000838 [Pseudozyma hubeiensis]|nr:hypothetical protein PHBOTO_000838 [Pseudozyma hubeiensis]